MDFGAILSLIFLSRSSDCTMVEFQHHKPSSSFTPRGFTARGGLSGSRSPKEAPKKTHHFTNTSAELTGNSNYTVSKLSANPAALQNPSASTLNGVVNETTSHALLISDQAVYVWKYNSSDAIPTTTQLPVTPGNNGFPPLALLISPSAGSTEPGVVVINSHSGHIRYYENIESASAIGLLHQRKGLETQLKLADREYCTLAESIEPAGVLVSTSTGRVILISLRDSAGKAAITTSEIVRRQASFFSSAVAPHRQMAAIKSGSVVGQGERIAATITRGGYFQVRSCARDGQSKVGFEQDLAEILIEHIQYDPKYAGVDLAKKLEIVDMALLPHFDQDVFLLLAALEVSPTQTYYIQFVIRREQSQFLLFSAYRIRTYTKPFEKTPQLYVPAPGSTAFIVFENAVVLAQLPTVLDHEMNNRLKKWEDIITFRSDVSIIGCGPEGLKTIDGEIVQYPSVHVMIPQVGVLRVERLQTSEENMYDSSSTRMLKTHIEQAVFYGVSNSGPLEFDIPDDIEIDEFDLKTDLLAVADEILSSSSSYIPPRLSSLDQHLELRLSYAEKLLHYASSNFGDKLDIDTKIALVGAYEKLAAGLSLHKCINKYNTDVKFNSELGKAVTAFKSNQAKSYDLFLNGLQDINDFLYILFKRLDETRNIDIIGSEIATSVYSSVMDAEKTYRYDLFGLDGSEVGTFEPWFTTNEMYLLLNDLFQKYVDIKSTVFTQDSTASSVAVAFAQILFYQTQQKAEWLKSKPTKTRTDQDALERLTTFVHARSDVWTKSLVLFGAKAEALAIAETYNDLKSLVEITEDDRENAQNLDSVHMRFDYLFSKFGYPFAETLYNYYIQTGKYQILLFGFPQYSDYLHRFFTENDHGKISWVKDMLDGDYTKASQVLLAVTQKTDEKQSHRHLHLSIAKLSALSAQNGDDELLQDIQEELDFVEAQEGILSQIQEFIRSDGDPAAQVDSATGVLLKEPYSSATSSVNKQSFQRALSRLLSNKSLSVNELVDTYTLLNSHVTNTTANCYCSLKVLHLANQPQAVKAVNEKLTWRRAILSDDWLDILSSKTKTEEYIKEKTEQSVLFETLLRFFKDELFIRNNDYQISLPSVRTLTEMDSDEDLLARYKFIGAGDLPLLKKEIQAEIDQIKALVSDFELEGWIKGLIGTANTKSGADRLINYNQLTIENI